MHLPQLNAATEGSLVDLVPLTAMSGNALYAVLIKAHYAFDEGGKVQSLPAATRHAPVPWPDDDSGESVMLPSDVCPRKPSTDVLVVGSAVAPAATVALDVFARVGPIEKSLRVFGPRTWKGGRPSNPLPFQRLPLKWEYAFGGIDFDDKHRVAAEWRNPVGRGVAADPDKLEGEPVARIEDPNDLIRDASSRPAPAGVAPIGPAFEPRKQWAGTYDDAWMRERMPLLPLDFDERFYQCAPPSLVARPYLVGGEPVQLLNIGRAGGVSLSLPRRAFHIESRFQREVREYRARLDTVLIQADDGILEMTWRVPIEAPPDPRQLSSISVTEKHWV